MAFAISLDLIRAELAQRVDVLVPLLCPNAERAGTEWVMGDRYGAPGRSLSIPRRGKYAGGWKDFASGEKGGLLDLIADNAPACNGRIGEAVRWAIDWLRLGDVSAEERARGEERARRQAAAAQQQDAQDKAKRKRQAKAIWLSGTPLPGTPAERYLLGRAIDLRALGRYPRALVFGAAVWNSEVRAKMPAMLAPINDGASGEMLAVHRTYLAVRPDGRVTKAALKEQKLSLGPFRGGHIPLWRGDSGKPLREAPDGEWITVAEGIETGLSIALAQPDMRVLASVSLSNLGGMRLPPQIGGLFVAADNDMKEDAMRGLERQLARLEARGLPFRIVRAPAPHKDFNDWLQALAAPAQGESEVAE